MKVGVIGNEASDADSIVSAIVYAWYLNKTQPENDYITFVQCPFEELEDRLDFQEICKVSKFRVTDSIESLHSSTTEISEWILLDHHFPSTWHACKFSTAFNVGEILDHHEVVTVESKNFVDSVKSVDIRTIGSTCTIVAQKLLATLAPTEIPQHLLWMLFLTIVIDTGNLSPELRKTTTADIEVYDQLKTLLKIDQVGPLFERLANAKFNPEFWNKAPLDRILRYDFKEMNGVGYSVILRSLVGIDDGEIAQYADSRGYRLFVVSSGFYDEESKSIKRELLLYLPKISESIATIITSVERLVPGRVHCVSKERCMARLEVLATAFSRKKFFPILLKILETNNVL